MNTIGNPDLRGPLEWLTALAVGFWLGHSSPDLLASWWNLGISLLGS